MGAGIFLTLIVLPLNLSPTMGRKCQIFIRDSRDSYRAGGGVEGLGLLWLQHAKLKHFLAMAGNCCALFLTL